MTGGDGEEEKIVDPGIYDSVSVLLSGDLVIDSVQVAPRIQSSEILVETELTNHGSARTVGPLTQQVKRGRAALRHGEGKVVSEQVSLAAGEHKLVRQTVAIPNAELWSPDHPFLYVLDTSSESDSSITRFGMREIHFDGIARS